MISEGSEMSEVGGHGMSTLRRPPHGSLRRTRGRRDSLRLHRGGLAPPAPCRFPGAPHSLFDRSQKSFDSERVVQRVGGPPARNNAMVAVDGFVRRFAPLRRQRPAHGIETGLEPSARDMSVLSDMRFALGESGRSAPRCATSRSQVAKKPRPTVADRGQCATLSDGYIDSTPPARQVPSAMRARGRALITTDSTDTAVVAQSGKYSVPEPEMC